MSGDVVGRARVVLEGVTEGPWFAEPVLSRVDSGSSVVCGGVCLRDVEFIAAARTLVPELVAEVERLQRQIGALVIDHAGQHREWGWDVGSRRRPNPTVIKGHDGRPIGRRPTLAMNGGRLYSRLVSEWELES